MGDARLEAFMIAVIEDMAERRTVDQRDAFNARLYHLSEYVEQHATTPNDHKIASELKEIAHRIGRYPRVDR